MILFTFMTHLFKRNSSYASLFSSALREGIDDTFKEMGYKHDNGNEKEDKIQQLNHSLFNSNQTAG